MVNSYFHTNPHALRRAQRMMKIRIGGHGMEHNNMMQQAIDINGEFSIFI
jgi:hypothetical protein